ncbi:MAG: GNAT family N-acetyltransferase [Hominenteromicrobium sp.]
MMLLQVQKLKLDEIKRIYDTHMQEAFPQSELRPYRNMEMLYHSGNYVCYGLFDGEKLLAYAYFSRTNDRGYLLLDYYAVVSGLRGSGIGSRFFGLLSAEMQSADGILLEVESVESTADPDEKKLRERRIAFYERCGCEKTRAKCLLYGVDFSIMLLPLSKPKPDSRTVLSELEHIYHVMFDDALYSRVCHPFLQEED